MNEVGIMELSDEEVVRRCRAGERSHDAFRVLYQRYAGLLYDFTRRLLGDRALAEDAVQESFIRLYRTLERFDTGRPLRPYILKIAHNVALTLLRRRKGLPEVVEHAAKSRAQVEGGPELALRRELREGVEAALLSLAPEHRSVLVLRHVQGLKLREIAEVLCCSERTARNRLSSGALLFQRELRDRGIVSAEVM